MSRPCDSIILLRIGAQFGSCTSEGQRAWVVVLVNIFQSRSIRPVWDEWPQMLVARRPNLRPVAG
jgi:hypothetical protein